MSTAAEEEKDVEKQELTEEEQQVALSAEMDELDMVRGSGGGHEPNAIDQMLAEEKTEQPEEQEPTAVKEGEGGPVTDPAKSKADSADASATTPAPTIDDLVKRLDAVEAKSTRLEKDNTRLNRELVRAHDRLKQQPQPPDSGEEQHNKDDSDIDPDVGKAIRTVVSKLSQEERVSLYRESEEDLLGEEGITQEDYDETIKRFFLPAQAADPKLTRRWNRSADPARFAYEEGKKIKESFTPKPPEGMVSKKDLEDAIAKAKEEGRQDALKNVLDQSKRVAGLPPSLSQAGRTPKPVGTDKLTSKGVPERELSEL